MPRLRIYQVDAFAGAVFGGNPAAVVPLFEWLDDARMQAIAAENNLSETAFLVPRDEDYALRWFTPTQEVPLCGHATLAAGWVVFKELEPGRGEVRFRTSSGILGVRERGERLELDLPAITLEPCEPPEALTHGLGVEAEAVFETTGDPNLYAMLADEATVRAVQPDLARLSELHPRGVVVTAPGDEVDFVSRYFAPSYGIPEDPVTGSIHCALTPYWAQRLGRSELVARQLSTRGGELRCALNDDRVTLAGQAVKYLEGAIWI